MQRACRYDQIEAAVCKGQAILVALHAADAAGEAKAGVGRDHAFHRQACAERAIGCAQIKRAAEPTVDGGKRSEEHTSELQSLMRISSAVFCLKKKYKTNK